MAERKHHQPLISIITVCYNAAQTIRDTLESVTEQNYPSIEYIVIDGGSNDGTVDIIKEYADKGIITHWVSEPDNGISDAFNKGLQKATGKYVQIVNADDWIDKNQLSIAVRALENNTDFGYAYGNLNLCDDNGKPKRYVQGIQDNPEKMRLSLKGMPHPSFLVRKETYDTIGGFDINCHIAMDYEWVSRCRSKNVHGLYVPELTVSFRDGGVSQRVIKKKMIEELKINCQYHGYILGTICFAGLFCKRLVFWVSRKTREQLTP